MTDAQAKALKWLQEHGGDGMFSRHHGHTVLAAGEIAPVMRSTWNVLRDLGHVEYYADGKRVRVTEPMGA